MPLGSFFRLSFYVAWDGPEMSKMQLEGILANGETFIQLVPMRPGALEEGRDRREKGWASSVAKLIEDIRYVVAKLTQGTPWGPVKKAAGDPCALSGADELVLRAVRSAIAQVACVRCALIIDHDLGGGANQYREKMIAQRLIGERAVIILTFEVQTLRYVLEIRTDAVTQRHMLDGMAVVIHLANLGLVSEVFYNDGVSFPRPDEIPELLVSLKQERALSLTIAIHDYFSVCPSQFLLNAEGRYCGSTRYRRVSALLADQW
ncbi:hypothetical protein LP415_23820 [Polaromonas sp. P1(28)-8]|nr:hypothetical protein LP415_23820 [Polaromonas sp. P1(28)-8]